MNAKMAGDFRLRDMISAQLSTVSEKLEQVEKTAAPRTLKAGVEKVASVIDPTSPDQIEKLAEALEFAAEKLAQGAVQVTSLGEGASYKKALKVPTVLETNTQSVGGAQADKKDQSKAHNVPMQTPMETPSDSSGQTATQTDEGHFPGGAPYPAKGPLKTAGVKGLIYEKLAADEDPSWWESQKGVSKAMARGDKGLSRLVADPELIGERMTKGLGHGLVGAGGGAVLGGAAGAMLGRRRGSAALGALLGGATGGLGGQIHGQSKADREFLKKRGIILGRFAGLGKSKFSPEAKKKYLDKKSSADGNEAIDYILGKIAEAEQGGMTLDSASEEGPKPESGPKGGNDGRSLISSADAVINATKKQAKAPQKRQLAEVLTEPALSKSTDSVVHNNLRSATSGGVKIAANLQLLQKIAEEGCTCGGKGECQHCKLMAAKKKVDEKKTEKSE